MSKKASKRKETEELIAGFDRPARAPRPSAMREIVERHRQKTATTDRRSSETVLVHGRRNVSTGVALLIWTAGFLLVLGGFAVAYGILQRRLAGAASPPAANTTPPVLASPPGTSSTSTATASVTATATDESAKRAARPAVPAATSTKPEGLGSHSRDRPATFGSVRPNGSARPNAEPNRPRSDYIREL